MVRHCVAKAESHITYFSANSTNTVVKVLIDPIIFQQCGECSQLETRVKPAGVALDTFQKESTIGEGVEVWKTLLNC